MSTRPPRSSLPTDSSRREKISTWSICLVPITELQASILNANSWTSSFATFSVRPHPTGTLNEPSCKEQMVTMMGSAASAYSNPRARFVGYDRGGERAENRSDEGLRDSCATGLSKTETGTIPTLDGRKAGIEDRAPGLPASSMTVRFYLACFVLPPLANRGFPRKRDGSGAGGELRPEGPPSRRTASEGPERREGPEARAKGCGITRRH
ncbi:hypothetical protein BQ8794_180041 [Mesorhizobium prunaredense]|uniref:Uncharacterized protein n=1 Tax=Mesorhizobium prunaredense TaxID=1631249 RepID=A0A1R3V4A0_9HYPH|nr:hypothetical protein BQ8794_180041 [Mesorhizobium prunaredense]